MEIQSTIKILVVFAAILGACRLKMSLGVALSVGGRALDLWSGHVALAGRHMLEAISQPNLWLFLLNIALIIEFGVFMTESENSRALVSIVHRWTGRHGRAFSMVLLPATLGLVPMPGGAMFSAPLVEKATGDKPLSPEWKSAANYWFRHIAEYWWPLYPVVIVTLSVFPMPIWKFILLQLPFTLASTAAGALFILWPKRGMLTLRSEEVEVEPGGLHVLLPLAVVFLSVITLPQLFGLLWPGLCAGTAKLLGMFAGLCAGLALIARHRRGGAKDPVLKQFFTKKNVNILMTIAGVMIFKSFLESSGVIAEAGAELGASGMPVEFVIAGLPFLAGLVTGVAVGFAGTTFPLIIGLVTVPGSALTPVSVLPLAFAMGYAGMMLSPLHLCLLLTRDYFGANLLKIYRYLIPCSAVIMLTGIAMHILFKSLGW